MPLQDHNSRDRRHVGGPQRLLICDNPLPSKLTANSPRNIRRDLEISSMHMKSYSDRVYGFNSVFLWYPLWLKLDKDRREEIDNQQAMADSTVYMVACLLVSGVLCIIYGALKALRLQFAPDCLSALMFLIAAGALAGAAYGLYRMSLHVHDSFGRTYRALFDVFLPDLTFPFIERHVDRMISGERIDFGNTRERNKMIMDFMLSGRVSVPGDGRRVWVDEWNDMVPTLTKPSTGDEGHGWSTSEQTVWCSGDRSEAHPRVFLRTNGDNAVQCPYCSRWLAVVSTAQNHKFGTESDGKK